MRRIKIFLGLLVMVLPQYTHALEAVVSHALFFRENGTSYLEVYWQANAASLHYRKDSSGLIYASIQTKLRISGDTGIVFRDAYNLETRAFDPAKEAAPAVFELSKADIPTGRLKIELYLSDGYSAGDFYFQDTLTVAVADVVFYSSLQLLDTFIRDKKPGPFSKGGFQQLPKAIAFYDEGRRGFHGYFELYRTNSIAASAFPLTQLVWLSRRKAEFDLPHFIVKDTLAKAGPVLSFRHSFSLATLESGNYFLNTSLTDAMGGQQASASTFFQIVNKKPDVVNDSSQDLKPVEAGGENILDLSKTFVAKFDMSQLRAILKMMLPAAEPVEVAAIRGFLAKPDEIYTRYFIYNFFVSKNKADPARAWKLFSDKVREANKYYTSGSTLGYETDRGITYLKYGEPAEIVRVPSESGAQPYEIWRYNVGKKITGSGVFLFYSPGYMRSDFRLLHSTVIGERNNPDWRSILYVNGQSSGKLNSRADEYLK